MKQVQRLTENLEELGHLVFSYVKDTRNFVPSEELNKQSALFTPGTDWKNNKDLRLLFERLLSGLEASDVVVLLLPAGKTSHIEAGIAYGLNKHLVLIGEPEKPETHYQIFDEEHATIEEYVAALRKVSG